MEIKGISQWREEGKKLGYWDYFEQEIENKMGSCPNHLTKPLQEYKKGELNRLRSWAKDEIREWQDFLDKVEEEYNKR